MRLSATLGLFAVAAPLLAHENEPLRPHDLWSAWTWDPLVVASLLLSGWLYWRGDKPGHGIRAWERRSYWLGWSGLAIALLSPMHAASDVLFSAHMVQHELLMLLCAPCLVLGRPVAAYVWALPEGWRRRAGQLSKRRWLAASWRWVTRPFQAWWIHAIALWAWHAPVLFQATLTSDVVHTLQHASFLGSALLFWWSLKARGRGFVSVFTTALHTSILGALLTFAPEAWYPAYADTAAAFGLSPLEDQQLGGLVMWVPGGLVFLGAGLVLFEPWMRSEGFREPPDWVRFVARK